MGLMINKNPSELVLLLVLWWKWIFKLWSKKGEKKATKKIHTTQINFFYICLKDKTALNYFCEDVMYLIIPLVIRFAKSILITYLIKMENEIKFANIFESSVKRFHKNLLLDVIIEYATRDQTSCGPGLSQECRVHSRHHRRRKQNGV